MLALSPEPQVEPQHIPVPIVHDILSSHDFIKIEASERLKYFEEEMKICKEAVINVAQMSSGRQANEIWYQIRKGTITAKSSWNTHALLRFSGSFPFSVSATGVEVPSPRQTMLSC